MPLSSAIDDDELTAAVAAAEAAAVTAVPRSLLGPNGIDWQGGGHGRSS